MKNKNITVVGLGRVGLPTALLFANAGFCVVGVDRDPVLCSKLNAGELPLVEPGLQDVLSRVLADGKFDARSELPEANETVIICVGTTVDGMFDAEPVRTLMSSLPDHVMVIVESTLPLGASDQFADRAFAYCPERLAPGTLFPTVFKQTRLVSAFDPAIEDRIASLYQSVGFDFIERVTPAEAEMCKLAENAFRDANIAFANQLAMTCSEQRVDARRIIELANTHPRVQIHQPGIGVGGACLAPASRSLAAPNDFFDAARQINEGQVDRIVFQLSEVVDVAVFGIAYKPESDDTRHSPAVRLIELLEEEGTAVSQWDPVAGVGSFDEIKTGAIVIGCGHRQFSELDPVEVHRVTGANLLIDFTGITDFDRWRSAGFSCISR